MKRVALLLLLGSWLVPAASAQEIGAYVDYFRVAQTKTNMVGLGGRFATKILPGVKLEGEMSYDFTRAFTEGFTDPSNGSITLQSTNLRILHGLVGPKIEAGRGRVKAFLTLKGGFVNFRLDPRPVTFATFASSVESLRAKDVNAVLYPGGGLEGRLGPLGLRLDVGDEITFNGGSHHNVRVAFGPFLHF